MSSLPFLNDESWDFPFFKKLARNDTGEGPGHQGGLVIPKDLRPFFPALTEVTSAEQPTVDRLITAVLVVNGQTVATVSTRYQLQTWHGTRRAESRLTGNLGPLRNEASSEDFLVIQRNLQALDLYRLCLITKANPAYKTFLSIAGDSNWGLVQGNIPLSQRDIDTSSAEEDQSEQSAFQLFADTSRINETRSRRIARSLVFRITVQKIYNYLCAVCGNALKSPTGTIEIDAAHIVPRTRLGSDDARNGIVLCKRHHWAFDNGLFGVDSDGKVVVPPMVSQIPQNRILSDLHGCQIRQANSPRLVADQSAFEWHWQNIVLR